MTSFGGLVRDVEPHGLLALADQLVFAHCHHYSLFLDQTIADALGGEGWAVRKQAAFEAAHALVSSLRSDLGVDTPDETLDLARELFAAMGHGQLAFEVTAEGGSVRGESLYHGASFAEKYGGVVRNRKPMDAFAAGFTAAAASLAFPSDWGHFEADETECVARRDAACTFVLTRRPERPRFGAVVTRAAAANVPARLPGAARSDESDRTSAAVTRMLCGIDAEEAGSVRAFGVRPAFVPVSYAGQISFETAHLVEKRTPELFPVFAALLREAAQIGAFHLMGGVLASPEWSSEIGPPSPDLELRLEQLLGMARSFGWGHLYAEDFFPGRLLVLRSPATHESVYHELRHGSTVRNRLTSLQGTALAMMQLLHRVDFGAEDPMPAGAYDALFKSGTRFHVEETRSPLRGDDCCEVSVEALADR